MSCNPVLAPLAPPPVLQAGEIVHDARPIATLFQEARTSASPKNIREFIQKAQQLSLSLAELEQQLSLLETGKIIATKEKYKALFFHAVKLENAEQAQGYLEAGKIDRASFAKELLELDEPPQLAFKLVCRDGLNLGKDCATIPTLRALLALEVDINTVTFDGKSLHVMALHTRNDSLIQATLQKNPHVGQEVVNDPVVREYYAKKRRVSPDLVTTASIIEFHKTLGIKVSGNRLQILQTAARSDDPTLVMHLFDDAAPLELLENNQTPLEVALQENPSCLKVIEALLESGVKVSQPFSTQSTALHVACEKQNSSLALLLVSRGADLLKPDAEGKIPLLLLGSSPLKEMLEVCKQQKFDQPEALKTLATHFDKVALPIPPSSSTLGFVHFVASTISKEQFCTPEGMKLFSSLCRLCKQPTLEMILSKGLDLFSNQPCGQSFFAKFLEELNQEGLVLLVQAGQISPNIKTADGIPLLFWALAKKKIILYQALLAKGAQTNVRGPQNKTLLHVATEFKSAKLVLHLLNLKTIPINALDDTNRPALYYAIKEYDKATVNALLFHIALPFFLGDCLGEYAKHVYNGNFESVARNTPTWTRFVASKEQNFIEFLKTVTFEKDTPRDILFYNCMIPQFPIPVPAGFKLPLLTLRTWHPDAPQEYFYPFMFSVLPQALVRKEANPAASSRAVTFEELFDEELGTLQESVAKKTGVKTHDAQYKSADFMIHFSPRTIIPLAESFFKRTHASCAPLVEIWFKENVPKTFVCTEETEFHWTMASLDVFTEVVQRKQQLLNKIAKKKGIETKGKPSEDDIIREIRAKNFLATHVYASNGALKREAILYFLQKRGIIQEHSSGIFKEFMSYRVAGKADQPLHNEEQV